MFSLQQRFSQASYLKNGIQRKLKKIVIMVTIF